MLQEGRGRRQDCYAPSQLINVCCFDLDGTLLPMDIDKFVKGYEERLSDFFREIIPAEKLLPSFWEASMVMIQNNDPTRTNMEVFMEHFLNRTQLEEKIVASMLDRFYQEEFPKLETKVRPTPVARQVVKAALERGYQVVIATNPVLPRIAVTERLRWAGIVDLSLTHITVNEESHFCKPNPNYYQEIVDYLEVDPKSCVMIGNDIQEDLVAQEIGMRTYLVTDCLIDRGKPSYKPDEQGTLSELLLAIRQGTGIFYKS